MKLHRNLVLAFAACGALLLLMPSYAADKKGKPAEGAPETVAKPLSDKEKKRREEKLRKELLGPYRKWLAEDVLYIITDEERTAFKRLATDEEREQFIEQFWLRRDPSPDSQENEFKEEHYRRIAYTNERYASGIPGWKTDRGRIYITFGPPDEIESHPSGGTYERPFEEGGGTTSTFPFEKWRYRWIQDIGSDIMIEFVDPTMTGEYRMTMDPSEKDALLYVPNAGLTMMEQMGMSSKADRFNRTDGTRLGTGTQPLPQRMNQFERLRQFSQLQKAPAVKFKDLEAAVNSTVKFNLLPMRVRADFMRMTASTVQTNITLQLEKRDLQFQNKDGIAKSAVNIYARITSMSRRVINVFEDVVTMEVPSDMLEAASKGSSVYGKSIPLPPGTYRINIVVKDVFGGNMNNYEMALNVPRLEDDVFGMSSVVLADLIEKVPTRSIGNGQFVIGTTKVRPRVTESFTRDEKMGIYVKFYNFEPDEKTRKPNATVHYEVVKSGSNAKIFEFSEDLINSSSATEVTIEKVLPLKALEPGAYELRLKVTDKVRNQSLSPVTKFTVT